MSKMQNLNGLPDHIAERIATAYDRYMARREMLREYGTARPGEIKIPESPADIAAMVGSTVAPKEAIIDLPGDIVPTSDGEIAVP